MIRMCDVKVGRKKNRHTRGVLTLREGGVGGCTREIEAIYVIKKRVVSLVSRVIYPKRKLA